MSATPDKRGLPSERLETSCRRCSVCEGMSHHWIADPRDPDDDEWEPGEYACKHCDQRGDGCNECSGDGYLEGDESQLCWTCAAEGVIPLTDEQYDHEFYCRIEARRK